MKFFDTSFESTSNMTTEELPKTHRTLVQRIYAEPLQLQSISVPQPTTGSAIVRVLAANVVSYMADIYNGKRRYSYPTPLVPGSSATGRVAAVGSDGIILRPGQLVFLDCVIRGRDDPSAIILSGIVDGSSEGSRKLMRDVWRDSTYAEYVKAPLENCFPLNESLLCGNPQDGGLGYEIHRLPYLSALLVPFGGLRDIRLEPGETVIIAPATGAFGGAAVHVALAMGARVIAMGRNTEILAKLKSQSRRVETVRMTGNQEEEVAALQKFGHADAYFDISPREAAGSSHLKSAILFLRHGGRISLMGGFQEDLAIPQKTIMRKDLKMQGKWIYSRDDISLLVKMIEIGILGMEEKDGVHIVGRYSLDKWEEAFQSAAKENKAGKMVLMIP
jgi:threonine dehydrogenase-like Zn-dependent dehydrogenase